MGKTYSVTYTLDGKPCVEKIYYPSQGARELNLLRAELEAQGATDFKAVERAPVAPTPIDNAITDVYLTAEGDSRIEALFAAYYADALDKRVKRRLEELLSKKVVHSESYLKAYDYCVGKGMVQAV